MQVKKFEAKSMKEALQLVKQELGPDAIILNAKDNKKAFGLGGSGSIEVTAAISEKALQKKKFAEARLPDPVRSRLQMKSAKQQKEYIEKTISRYVKESRPQTAEETAPKARAITSRRYIDITDEEASESPMQGRRVSDVLEDYAKTGAFVLEDAANKAQPIAAAVTRNDEVLQLKKEIESLKAMLGLFQTNVSREPVTRHPGAEYGLPYEFNETFEKLQNAGLDERYIVEVLEKADKELTPIEKKKRALVGAWAARYLLAHTNVISEWLQPGHGPQIHIFVGPSGQGKTSTLVKTASHLIMNEKKKVAVLTGDSLKVGAADQLKIYCQILGIPFDRIKHSIEFSRLPQRFAEFDAVLVDFPGLTLKEISEIDQIRMLLPPREVSAVTHLVLGCGMKDVDAYESCHRYQITHFSDIIVTKLDESVAHGFLYNVQRKTEKPLYLFGVGPKVPEDIELATRERVVDLIFKITKKTIY